jgi:hypothetical protein
MPLSDLMELTRSFDISPLEKLVRNLTICAQTIILLALSCSGVVLRGQDSQSDRSRVIQEVKAYAARHVQANVHADGCCNACICE